jgi:uncharacterized metal-binding protein YceD (DUF177 family)
VAIDPWPDAGVKVNLSADPVELRAIARRFDLAEVRSLHGHGRIERLEEAAELVFRGWLEADVVQTCVVSLEPVPAKIRRPVERRYRPGATRAVALARLQPSGMVDLDDAEDEVEPLIGREIDLGEALAEELALALDPYPRVAGAAMVETDALGPHVSLGRAEPGKPFAALRQLQDKHPR